MLQQHSHCSFCGARYPDGVGWPRRCPACESTTYRNPLPVAVALLPVGGGLLTVRRAIPPRLGELALPGGFMNVGEGWAEATARELWEETGISVAPEQIRWFDSLSSPGGHLLIFGLCPALAALPALAANDEVSELAVIDRPAELAFPLHTEVARRFFTRGAA